VAASGAEARARLLDAHASSSSPIRGVGEVRARVGDRGGSFQARWGSAGESLIVVGYAGPVRALDAAMLGDSVYVVVRPEERGVAGIVRGEQGLGPDAVRFILRPWDFSVPWFRDALERAAVEPWDRGWRLRADAATTGGNVALTLDLDGRGEPRELRLRRATDPGSEAVIRYGASRRYAAGRYPRWVEWTRQDARVRLDLRDVDPLPGGALRALPPPHDAWRILSLEEPEGRKLLDRLLGSRMEESR
jgi:hypothetical protein